MLAWQLVGASELAVAVAHLLLWRLFGWSRELRALSPLTARVFAVHTFFVAFVLAALGTLELGRPDLLVMRSELALFLLGGATLFWLLRLLAQPLVFDSVLLRGSSLRTPVRLGASLGFALFAGVHAYGFMWQLR